jgi:hypothetical protein
MLTQVRVHDSPEYIPASFITLFGTDLAPQVRLYIYVSYNEHGTTSEANLEICFMPPDADVEAVGLSPCLNPEEIDLSAVVSLRDLLIEGAWPGLEFGLSRWISQHCQIRILRGLDRIYLELRLDYGTTVYTVTTTPADFDILVPRFLS